MTVLTEQYTGQCIGLWSQTGQWSQDKTGVIGQDTVTELVSSQIWRVFTGHDNGHRTRQWLQDITVFTGKDICHRPALW